MRMVQKISPVQVLVLLVLAVPALVAWGQVNDRPRVRAELPQFDEQQVRRIFFEDVFEEGLVGERPDLKNIAKTPSVTPGTNPGTPEGTAPAGGVFAWSKIISPATLEDEVKASKLVIDSEVSTPSKFAGSGYKVARKQFSVLAVMFGIIGEYDGDVRWQDDGPTARDLFARTASNAKVGTIQVYNEAKARKLELEDLLNGASLKRGAAEPKAVWPQVTDRSPLMQRLEVGNDNRLQPWLSNKAEFSDNVEDVIHEAELIAAFAEVLKKEGMEDGDDSDYQDFCNRMQQAALEIVDAAKSDNYDKARAAAGEINKACSECHELYRAG